MSLHLCISFISFHSFHSFIHRLTNSLIHWSTGSFNQLSMDSFVSFHWHLNHHCSFDSFNRSLLLHLKDFPIGHHLILAWIFRNFCPGMRRALPGIFSCFLRPVSHNIFYLKKRWPAKQICCKLPWNHRKIFHHYISGGFYNCQPDARMP